MTEKMHENTSLQKRSALLLTAKIFGFAFAFLLPLLVVRYLSQSQVGVYRQVFLVIMNAVSILPLGFSMSAYYFLSRETERRNSAIFNILLFNFAVGAIGCAVLVFFPQILGKIFHNDEVIGLAPPVGLTIWLWIFSAFLETVSVADRDVKLSTWFIISAQLTKTVLMSGAVIIFSTVESFLYAAIVQGILQTIVLLVYLSKKFPKFWKSFDAKFFREQAVYALPFGFAGLLWSLQADLHNYFVSNKFSAAEFAIYSYGCFQLPLIAMIHESVASVLIPRMSELQNRNDKAEIVRLLSVAMQKLAFFYFPIYAFLLITAQTFITTLFTEKYAASVPIFLINLTLLPFDIWITDPVVRAYRELGRFLLNYRLVNFFAMIAALFYGLQYFSLEGMIGIVVVMILVERFIFVYLVCRKLGVGFGDIKLLKGVLKTAIAAFISAIGLFAVYFYGKTFLLPFFYDLTARTLSFAGWEKLSNFVGGGLFLGFCALIFGLIYIFTTDRLGLINQSEKDAVKKIFGKFFGRFKTDEPAIINR